jgi:hypothetical protein
VPLLFLFHHHHHHSRHPMSYFTVPPLPSKQPAPATSTLRTDRSAAAKREVISLIDTDDTTSNSSATTTTASVYATKRNTPDRQDDDGAHTDDDDAVVVYRAPLLPQQLALFGEDDGFFASTQGIAINNNVGVRLEVALFTNQPTNQSNPHVAVHASVYLYQRRYPALPISCVDRPRRSPKTRATNPTTSVCRLQHSRSCR